jgi:16S rRNA (adenine1518-N6/adenine1519-N6)-dimethyltransferase
MEVQEISVRERLDELGIRPSARLSQNFLESEEIAHRMIEACDIDLDSFVVEVGPGLGIFTGYLCDRAGRIFAVEKDKTLFDFLTRRFQDASNLTLLNRDILSVRLSTLSSEQAAKFKIISNLPFSITSDFLYWLLDNRNYVESCTVILQSEVAKRLCAEPGTKIYGALSVLLQFYMDVESLFPIRGHSFYPRSNVTSEVLFLSPRNAVPDVNEKLLLRTVHDAFRQRRKKLRNSLALKTDSIEGIDLSRRPESLTHEEFARLTNALERRDKKD